VVLHFSRYLVVGVANTVVYYGCFLLLHRALPYFGAHLLAFGVAMVVSFLLNSWWTFRVRPTWRKFLMFPLSNAANFVVTSGGVVALVELGGVPERIAPLIAAAAAVPVTFWLARVILTR
jgi:putative flippase GtrA